MKPCRLQFSVYSSAIPWSQTVKLKIRATSICKRRKQVSNRRAFSLLWTDSLWSLCIFSTEASRELGETLLRFCAEKFWLKENLRASFIESTVEMTDIHTHKSCVVPTFGCSYHWCCDIIQLSSQRSPKHSNWDTGGNGFQCVLRRYHYQKPY